MFAKLFSQRHSAGLRRRGGTGRSTGSAWGATALAWRRWG